MSEELLRNEPGEDSLTVTDSQRPYETWVRHVAFDGIELILADRDRGDLAAARRRGEFWIGPRFKIIRGEGGRIDNGDPSWWTFAHTRYLCELDAEDKANVMFDLFEEALRNG